MRSTKKTSHFNLTLFFLLIIGIVVMVTGSVYAEEDMTAEENIKVIEVDTLNFVFDPAFLNENLMYVGLAVRGRFFAEEKPANPAYTHFHKLLADFPAAGHGWDPGAEGYWLRHIAVREMEMPWGEVLPGVDFNFMVTPAPELE